MTPSQTLNIVDQLTNNNFIFTTPEVSTICNTTHTKIALQSTLKQCLMDLDEGESISCYENQFPLKTSNFQNWFLKGELILSSPCNAGPILQFWNQFLVPILSCILINKYINIYLY